MLQPCPHTHLLETRKSPEKKKKKRVTVIFIVTNSCRVVELCLWLKTAKKTDVITAGLSGIQHNRNWL